MATGCADRGDRQYKTSHLVSLHSATVYLVFCIQYVCWCQWQWCTVGFIKRVYILISWDNRANGGRIGGIDIAITSESTGYHAESAFKSMINDRTSEALKWFP